MEKLIKAGYPQQIIAAGKLEGGGVFGLKLERLTKK